MFRLIALIAPLTLLALGACSSESTNTAAGGGAGGSGGDGGGAGGSAAVGGAAARCQSFCDAVTYLSCPEGPTKSSCLLSCQMMTPSPKCDPTGNTFFQCAEVNGIKCNILGKPVANNCDDQWMDAIRCAVNESPNAAMVDPCKTYCEKVDALKCLASPTVEDCNTSCMWLGTKGTGCEDKWGTYLSCANLGTLKCPATAPACDSDLNAYSTCLKNAG